MREHCGIAGVEGSQGGPHRCRASGGFPDYRKLGCLALQLDLTASEFDSAPVKVDLAHAEIYSAEEDLESGTTKTPPDRLIFRGGNGRRTSLPSCDAPGF
jgi:hypothetical protein